MSDGARTGVERVEVVVVGAGSAGLATARALGRAGRRVLVVEQFGLAHERGSSHGQSRIVRLAHDNAPDVADAIEAFRLWHELERDTGTSLVLPVGGVEFGPRLPAVAAALDAHDVGYEMLSPDRIETRFPTVAAHGQSAMYQADSGIVLADVALSAIAKDAVDHGVEIRCDVRVHDIADVEDGVRLRTSDGEIVADAVVLATGAWITELATQAGWQLPAQATLQTPVYLRLDGSRPGPVPTVLELQDDGRDFYALPDASGTIVKGGVHNPAAPVDLDGSRDADPELVAEFVDWTRRRYVGLDPTPIRSYGCIYTWLPDSRFALERRDRVVLVSCCSGRGFKFTPLTGRRAAALVDEVLEPQPATARA